MLQQLVGKTQFTVANSKDFVKYIKGERITSDEVMVSLDVRALYTSLPLERTVEVVAARLKDDGTLSTRTPLTPQHLTLLLKICLTSTYFVFRQKYSRLADGVAMGSPVSSVNANLFMEHFEKGELSSSGAVRPRVWKRYVDDVFSILLRTNVDSLLNHTNNIDGQIDFTVEKESNGRLLFLDASIKRMHMGFLVTSVFCKQTHTDRVLIFNSSHSNNAKAAVVRALVGRIETHFAEDDVPEGQDLEAARVHEVLRANDYPDQFVESVLKRRVKQPAASSESEFNKTTAELTWVSLPYIRGMSEAIGSVLRPLGIGVAHRASPWKWAMCNGLKDSIPEKLRKGVIYKVPCIESDAVYIGETLRNLDERLKEHKRHVEKKNVKGYAIAEHVIKSGHEIAWDRAGVIDYEQKWGARKIKESLHIKSERADCQLMNRDGGLAISAIWQQAL